MGSFLHLMVVILKLTWSASPVNGYNTWDIYTLP